MIQEDKELLLKDLCSRLPYKVKVEAKGLLKTIANDYDNRGIINAHVLNGLNLRDYFKTYSVDCIQNVPLFNRKGVCNVKPYLFSFSSMTEEQIKKVNELSHLRVFPNVYLINWYLENHFDIYGFIEKGLAIDATGLNIY